MEGILNHVSESSTSERILSPRQFDILVSTEGQCVNRSMTPSLEIKIMYSSLYICYRDLCKTCESRSMWTPESNVNFIHKAHEFISELDTCIHRGVPRSKVLRDAIILIIGVGHSRDSGVNCQDWDQILGDKFFDWVAHRASCIGNEIIGMTDEMYESIDILNILSTTRNVLMIPLSDMANSSSFHHDLRLARSCFSISHRVRSIFGLGSETRMVDFSRAITMVLSEWVVCQC